MLGILPFIHVRLLLHLSQDLLETPTLPSNTLSTPKGPKSLVIVGIL